MKAIFRALTYAFLALKASQYVISGFSFGDDHISTFLLVLLGLSLLYFFLKPVLKIIGLPTKGMGFLFLSFVSTVLVLYIMTLSIPSFYIKETTLSDLIIFGFVLPSKDLSSLASGVFSAFVISLVYIYFDWLRSRK